MFLLSKLAEITLQAGNFLVLVLLIGTCLLFSRALAIWGRRMVVMVVMSLAAIAGLPLDDWLITPLENRFAIPDLPSHVDGIIALGGALSPTISSARGQPSGNTALERLTSLAELSRHYPMAKVIFTGGSGSLVSQDVKEGPIAVDFLKSIGMDVDRLIVEDQSRTTRENAVLTQQIVKPQSGEVWVLITSANHMPRSVGAFRAIGWQVTAYPVDYLTTGHGDTGGGVSLSNGLSALSTAQHEWGGLLYYRIRGWSSALFPAP